MLAFNPSSGKIIRQRFRKWLIKGVVALSLLVSFNGAYATYAIPRSQLPNANLANQHGNSTQTDGAKNHYSRQQQSGQMITNEGVPKPNGGRDASGGSSGD